MDAFLAVELSDLQALRDALDAGVDIHQEKDGLTLLHYAIDVESDAHVQTGEPLHVDLTALLLARGADPQRRSGGGSGVSAEHMAALAGHWLALELFKGWPRTASQRGPRFGVAADAVAGQVSYGSTDLSGAVQAARVTAKDRGGNYAAGLLEDGTTLVGRSSADLHAEEDIIRQAGGRTITDMYSEREPCLAKCSALTQDMNVTWSWPWNPSSVRPATNAALKAAVKGLFQ